MEGWRRAVGHYLAVRRGQKSRGEYEIREGGNVRVYPKSTVCRSVLGRVSKEIPNGELFPQKHIYFVTDTTGGRSQFCVQPFLPVFSWWPPSYG